MDPALQPVADALARASSVVVLTGAGISAESGLRTFRETMDLRLTAEKHRVSRAAIEQILTITFRVSRDIDTGRRR